MALQLTEPTLVKLLRRVYQSPFCSSSRNHLSKQTSVHSRNFQTTAAASADSATRRGASPAKKSNDKAPIKPYEARKPADSRPEQNIAILGGGITGLTTAFHLSENLKDANITIYEKSDRLGGWIDTKEVMVNGQKMCFEQGPRTIRPAPKPQALVMFELMGKLLSHPANRNKLISQEGEILLARGVLKTSPASANRYIYYPDRLVKMPGAGAFDNLLGDLFIQPIFKGLIWGALTEPLNSPRDKTLEDESVGSFLRRRFGSSYIGDNILSALLHGIYAGDIEQLSVKSLFPRLWEAERKDESIFISFLIGLLNKHYLMQRRDYELTLELLRNSFVTALNDAMNGDMAVSAYSFRNGNLELVTALKTALESNPRVNIKMNQRIQNLAPIEGKDLLGLTTKSDHKPAQYSKVISTISDQALASITSPEISFNSSSAVTVMVIHLCYDDPDLLPVQGFGYLIPRSVPMDQNPERALGVIFNSTIENEQYKNDEDWDASYTKLTVMLGGHWWEPFDEYPTEEEGIEMAKAVVKRHLKIKDRPVAAIATLQKDCIPQYMVGHDARMRRAHEVLQTGSMKGMLAVAGSSYTGVGLNDCVRAARDVAMGVIEERQSGKKVTGLEQFEKEREWVRVDRKVFVMR